ncbi:MAG: hypothetical protein JWP91_4218 [Fibrobacteres bacterium]|nr:hypothetical protein [Fibrobacterota bacterium]
MDTHGGNLLRLGKAATLAASLAMALAAQGAAVDPSTIEGKVLFGYQGWFNCPTNGSGSWVHWSRGVPSPTALTVEMYPDLTEFKSADLCAAGGMTIGGQQAYLFSSRNANVVDAHFRWMEQYGLDGVFVQRFIGSAPGARNSGDQVLRNVMASAAAHGRTFAIEYDLTGGQEASFTQAIQTDWKYMVDVLKVTSHPNYLHQNGKPVVSLWGPGINDGSHIPADPKNLVTFINWFKAGPEPYRAFYMGGTPAGWATGNGDSYGGTGWADAFKLMDAIQPWTVGRYKDTNETKSWARSKIAPDVAKTKANGNLYMPVIFPGFSWSNLKPGSKQNQIPRIGGKFLWSQAYGAKANGATMLKIAMFDEVDEGTAMFKLAPKRSLAPDQGFWLTLDADGHTGLPSDWYLRLAGEITAMFHGTKPTTPVMPMNPANPIVGIGPRAEGIQAAPRFSRVAGGFRFRSGASMRSIGVYTPMGRLVHEVALSGGEGFWDGRDAMGAPVPTGTYLAKASGGGTESEVFRVVLP